MTRRGERKRTERLRLVVDTLPYETRVAMLEGLERYEIIAGAYSDRGGGVCPMLAAHRCGPRTDLSSFARAWDRFTGTKKRARRASQRELRTLAAHLEASIWREDEARYAHSHVQAIARRPTEKPRAEATGTDLLGAWLLPFRDLETYLRALELAHGQIDGERSEEPVSERRPDAALVR